MSEEIPIGPGNPRGEYGGDSKGGGHNPKISELTIRDLFAAHALAGLTTTGPDDMWPDPDALAEKCYEIADSMMEIRNDYDN